MIDKHLRRSVSIRTSPSRFVCLDIEPPADTSGREREREKFHDVRDGEDIRARNGWEKYVRILARSCPRK